MISKIDFTPGSTRITPRSYLDLDDALCDAKGSICWPKT
jgi:hypothetical protein